MCTETQFPHFRTLWHIHTLAPLIIVFVFRFAIHILNLWIPIDIFDCTAQWWKLPINCQQNMVFLDPNFLGGECVSSPTFKKGFIKSMKQSTGPFQWLDIVSTFYRIPWLLLCTMASVHKRLVPGDISTVVTLSLSLPSSNLTLNLYELSFNSSWVDILRSGDGASLVWIFYDHWERVLACCCWKIDWVGLRVSRRG